MEVLSLQPLAWLRSPGWDGSQPARAVGEHPVIAEEKLIRIQEY